MTKTLSIVLVVAAVVFVLTALLSGEPLFILPVLAVMALPAVFLAVNKLLSKRIADQHDGDPESAVSDNEDSIPSTHLVPDDTRPLGDTPEAHDEISPHDLPPGHPSRQAAEEQSAGEGAEGTTRGNAQGGDGGASVSGDDRTGERTGVRQVSSDDAK